MIPTAAVLIFKDDEIAGRIQPGLAPGVVEQHEGNERRRFRWRRLHQLVYCIASLALVHYFMQSKLGIGEPLMMAALFGWSMAYRLIGWLAGAESAVRSWIVVALSPLSAEAHCSPWHVLPWIMYGSTGTPACWSAETMGLNS